MCQEPSCTRSPPKALPLFYKAGWHVGLPLEATNAAAFEGVPKYLRAALIK